MNEIKIAANKKRLQYRLLNLVLFLFRLHNVSSSVLRPNWVPFAATKVAEEVLMFSLKLMTGFYIYYLFFLNP